MEMNSSVIIECCKGSLVSDQKSNLIELLEKISENALWWAKIEENNEMYNWNGEDWIKNINNKNPIIKDEIFVEMDNCLQDEFLEYAVHLDSSANHSIFELCGVFWHVAYDSEFVEEITGPSIDKEWIYSWMP